MREEEEKKVRDTASFERIPVTAGNIKRAQIHKSKQQWGKPAVFCFTKKSNRYFVSVLLPLLPLPQQPTSRKYPNSLFYSTYFADSWLLGLAHCRNVNITRQHLHRGQPVGNTRGRKIAQTSQRNQDFHGHCAKGERSREQRE